MRIVFLAVDDEFAGRMQKCVYQQHPEWIVGSVISTRAIYKKSGLGAVLFVLRKSGMRYAAEMFRMKIVRSLGRPQGRIRPSQLAAAQGVECFYSENINDEASLARLRSWSPDVVISTNFSHYIGEEARGVGRFGTWNLHKSYLPHYRGMAPSFHALLNGEAQVGATLHRVAKGFDTGDIIAQVRVDVRPEDTVYSLNQRTSEAGGRMLADLLDRTPLERISAMPQPGGDWPNHTYPSPADVRAFLRKGLRF